MFDLGDPVPLSVFIIDETTGNPANATAVTLTITLPDGTTVTPTVTNPATGTYTVTGGYYTVQTGRHEVFWSATGTNACDFEDSFFVQPRHQLIISLAEARSSLRLPAGQTVDDEDLRSLIGAATVVMEDLCGPIVSRACDETHDGGHLTVRLLQAPIISVTAVKESYGAGYTRALTEQALDGATFDAFGYTVDKDDGVLTRRMSGVAGPFMNGRRNIHVTYTAGRSVVRSNLIRATRRLVRFMWQQEMQGQRPNGQAPEQVATSTTPSGYLVPNAVKALCADDLRTVGHG